MSTTPAAATAAAKNPYAPDNRIYVNERFRLSPDTRLTLMGLKPSFGYNGFGELTFYRTYSRAKYEYAVGEVDAAGRQVVNPDGSPVTHTPFTRHPGDYRLNHKQAKEQLAIFRDRHRGDPGADDAEKFVLVDRMYGQETWAECVIRVIEGVLSIRKDWYVKHGIAWEDEQWQAFGREMGLTLFDMWWMPPGRGLWAMGTEFVYERGALALQNCGFKVISDDFGKDLHWIMDALMCGVGVGFWPKRSDDLKLTEPHSSKPFLVPDSREGWIALIKKACDAFVHGTPLPVPDYSRVRAAGSPIRGFGGVASGPGPLHALYEEVLKYCRWYVAGVNADGQTYDSVMLKTDLANAVGCCVVAGNVRRSAELSCCPISDPVFMDLKNYEKYEYREQIGWMSNNSVMLETHEDFGMLGEIAKRVIRNGEPGYINRRNMPHGRVGKFEDWATYRLREDKAVGFNPCGEMPQEDAETCNIGESLPTRAMNPDPLIDFALDSQGGRFGEPIDRWYLALRFVTFYCSTVSLLPTHRPETNAVIARNRRIGVGIIDVSGWKHQHGVHKITRWMRDGYKVVRRVNKELANEAGVVESNRVTTIKPGGTTPKLGGKTPGIGNPTFVHTLRRVRVGVNTPIYGVLKDAVPHEPDVMSRGTEVFEFPILQGPAKPALDVGLWEQAATLVLVQREWADNAVSNTLYFRPRWYTVSKIEGRVDSVELPNGQIVTVDQVDPDRGLVVGEEYRLVFKKDWDSTGRKAKVLHIQRFDPKNEEDDIEPVLSFIAPLTKSVSLLPHSPVGAYPQMPEEGITPEEYERRRRGLKLVDWAKYCGSDGQDEKYCQGDTCVKTT
jgi:ribonucleoside-triphosphate reductase